MSREKFSQQQTDSTRSRVLQRTNNSKRRLTRLKESKLYALKKVDYTKAIA